MGFYQITLKKDLDIHPRFFGKTLKSYLQDKLLQEVEGTCNGKYGYIVAVTKITYYGPGIVRKDGTGFCTFSLEYEAIVCRPYKGEVTDTVVTSVNKVGFFAEAGPLQIFVSSHLIPEDWEFNAVGDPCYQSPDASLTIQEGSQVRLRIVGIKMDQNEIYCIGSIKEDYLGFIAGSV